MTNWNAYTDLIDETIDGIRLVNAGEKRTVQDLKGIHYDEIKTGRVKVVRMNVSPDAARKIGKSPGEYITITIPTLYVDDDQGWAEFEQSMEKEWSQLLQSEKITDARKMLIIGLGNKRITPDSIGPATIQTLQEHYLGSSQEKKEIYLYAPGVTAQSGLETSDFISLLANELKVDVIVVIDALAAKSHERLCRTVQFTTSGIHPGSGIGNKRKEISARTMGCPVIAIGVPTVVDAPVIVAESIENLVDAFQDVYENEQSPSKKLAGVRHGKVTIAERNLSLLTPLFGKWMEWSPSDRLQLMKELLPLRDQQLFVSPKEMDAWLCRYQKSLSRLLLQWLK
ncbi:GPR endopeptidase [Paenisporosarcina cavernae]|uniref:GPR endopeptidase n=1 Tax=Paenisporosarcina cavernae TaxID=2320858 RepID=UPI0013C480E0|nr:GPR endopeptidase [Paenisporosarcina cavernae]